MKEHIRFSIFRINTIQKLTLQRETEIEIISSCRVVREFFTGLYMITKSMHLNYLSVIFDFSMGVF